MRTRRPTMYPILYVEDDPRVARSMVRLMSEERFRFSPVHTLAAASARFESEEWTGIVADYHLPDGCGLDFVLAARARRPGLPVAVATADLHVVNDVSGADVHIVVKPFLARHLSPFFGAVEAFERCPRGPRVYDLARRVGLTRRELEVLQLSLDGSSVEAIVAALGISAGTVKTHRANVLRKVGASDVDALRVRLFGLVGD